MKVPEVTVENILLPANHKLLSIKDDFFKSYDWIYIIIKTGCQACNENALFMLKKICSAFPQESLLVICNFDSKIDFKVIQSDLKQFKNTSLFHYPSPFVYYRSLPLKSTILISWRHIEEKFGPFFVIENGDDSTIIKNMEKIIQIRDHKTKVVGTSI